MDKEPIRKGRANLVIRSTTLKALKALAYGSEGTYDDVIGELINQFVADGETLEDAGRRLKEKAQ